MTMQRCDHYDDKGRCEKRAQFRIGPPRNNPFGFGKVKQLCGDHAVELVEEITGKRAVPQHIVSRS